MKKNSQDCTRLTRFGGQINRNCSNRIVTGISIQLSYQKIIVLHSQWKLLHICKILSAQKIVNLYNVGVSNRLYLYNLWIHCCNPVARMIQQCQRMKLTPRLEFASDGSLHATPLSYQWVIKPPIGYQWKRDIPPWRLSWRCQCLTWCPLLLHTII